jgi:hypothetical protein
VSSTNPVVQLAAFLDAGDPAHFRPDTAELAAARPSPGRHRHPERATTVCGCRSPEPCYQHTEVSPAGAGTPTGSLVTRWAPSVCQCIAPEPCRVHPDDRPHIKRPPAWALADPAGPVGRLDHRPEPGGALLEVETRTRLPKLSDSDVAMLVRLVTHEASHRGLRVSA